MTRQDMIEEAVRRAMTPQTMRLIINMADKAVRKGDYSRALVAEWAFKYYPGCIRMTRAEYGRIVAGDA